MPNFCPVAGLQKLCYVQIVDLIKNFSSNTSTTKDAPQRARLIRQALQYLKLPRAFVIPAVTELKKDIVLTTELVVLLCELGLTELNLSSLSSNVNFGMVLELLTTESKQRIEFLKMTGVVEHVPLFTLMQLPRHLPNLVSILLPYTACNDRILSTMAKCCVNLAHLDITRCPVSDKGLVTLYDGISHVSKISVLVLFGTKVTYVGVANAMLHLAFLEVVRYDRMVDALINLTMHHKDCVLPLKTLRLDISIISTKQEFQQFASNFLSILSNSFLSLRDFSVVIDLDLPLLSYVPLISLKDLRILCLYAGTHQQLFSRLTSIFRIIGQQLEELSLVSFNRIDLQELGRNCCQLQRLLLHNVDEMDNANVPRFRELQFLQLGDVPVNVIEDFIAIHANQIRRLHLFGCPDFGSNLWTFGDLQYLEHISVHECPCLTLEDLLVMITNFVSPLGEINIDQSALDEDEISQVQQFIKENNLQIEMGTEDISHLFGESRESYLQVALCESVKELNEFNEMALMFE